VATWWFPFVDAPPRDLAPDGINKIHPLRHHPDFTTHALGDSRSVQPRFLIHSAAVITSAVETTHLNPARGGFRISGLKPT
jgi:hypothetical protein